MTKDDYPQVHDSLGSISAWMETLTAEQRYRWFKNCFLADFTHEEDGTTYLVRTHYSPDAAETLQEKAERLIAAD